MSEDIDFDSRRLCPDGACIGVIGADGRCKVCGRADDGSIAPRTAAAAADSLDDGDDDDGDDDGVELDAASGEEAFADDDRELCPDGACIGVIGPDGRCKVCGTPRS